MPTTTYLNFDLQIQNTAGDEYSVTFRSPAGEPPNRLIFNKSDLVSTANSPLVNVNNDVDPNANNRHIIIVDNGNEEELIPVVSKPLPFQEAKDFGKNLFSKIFRGGLRTAFDKSIVHAESQKAYLRIRFNLTHAPKLAVLPWEYLCNDKGLFFAKDRKTSVTRYLNHDEPIEELLVSNPPLRVLVVISMPLNQNKLDAKTEWDNIKNAFRELEESRLIELDLLEKPTFSALEEKLAMQSDQKPYHILHFIGHGAFNKKTEQGCLLLEDDQGNTDIRSSEEIADILRNYPTLRLIVLNSCEGASTSLGDSYSGTAQDFLYRADVPAVIAMQYEITDKAALVFSRRFYQMIAKSQPVDEAVFFARLGMSGTANETEWVTPVLYVRADSGNLFDFKNVSGAAVPKASKLVNQTEMDKHYSDVISAIIEGNLVPFVGLDANLYGRKEIDPWTPGKDLPSSQELACYLASQYDYPFKENLDLTSITQYVLVKEKFISRLYNRLSPIFEGKYPLTPVHKLLADIPAVLQKSTNNNSGDPLRRRYIIITTNYDKQLEEAFINANLPCHIVAYATTGKFYHEKFVGRHPLISLQGIDDPTNYSALSDRDPVILKLPGAFDPDEQRYAITEDHYSDYLTYKALSALLPKQLTLKIKTSNNLFIGSSLRNWHLRALLYRVWGGQTPGNISWVVHPNMSKIDKEFWKASNVNVIEEDFDIYISELNKRLENL